MKPETIWVVHGPDGERTDYFSSVGAVDAANRMYMGKGYTHELFVDFLRRIEDAGYTVEQVQIVPVGAVEALDEAMEIVKAVAHIGIDWGYGKFELEDKHIEQARKLFETQQETEVGK